MQELVYPNLLLSAVEQYGDREGLVDGAFRATWSEHLERVGRLCHALAGPLGVGAQDRFAVLALNGHAYLELWHAAFMGAGVINPLNLRLAPKDATLRTSGSTDHVYMQTVGVNGFQFIQDPLDYGSRLHHTSIDSYDHLRAEDLRQAAVILASLLLSAANSDEPLPRMPTPTRPTPSDPYAQ